MYSRIQQWAWSIGEDQSVDVADDEERASGPDTVDKPEAVDLGTDLSGITPVEASLLSA